MTLKQLHFKKWPALFSLSACLGLGAFASAQSVPAQSNDNGRTAPDLDRNPNRGEASRFDQFLDSHREIAEQVRKDPSLLNNRQFVKNHPALDTFLKDNPGIRQQISNDPTSFMVREDRYDRREDSTARNGRTREEMLRFDQFLNNHRDAEQRLRKNPSLVNDQQFLRDHPAVQSYLQEHPGVRQEIQQNPNSFTRQDYRNDQGQNVVPRADRDRDDLNRTDRDANRARDVNRDNDLDRPDRDSDASRTDRDAYRDNDAARVDRDQSDRDRNDINRDDRTRRDSERFNDFLDQHREIGEQVRRNPSLVDDQQFLKNHPALQTYVQQHPGIREEINNNPNAFTQEQTQARSAYEHGGVDATGRQQARVPNNHDSHYASFGEFLGTHNNVAREISRDPSVVKNHEYVQSHPELQSYLNAHPEVRDELMANPHSFIKQAQQYNTNNGQPGQPPKTPTTDPTKPKQK